MAWGDAAASRQLGLAIHPRTALVRADALQRRREIPSLHDPLHEPRVAKSRAVWSEDRRRGFTAALGGRGCILETGDDADGEVALTGQRADGGDRSVVSSHCVQMARRLA